MRICTMTNALGSGMSGLLGWMFSVHTNVAIR
jgi:hypothetical protein